MTKKLLTNVLIGSFILGLCSSVYAGKPTQDDSDVYKGNGYPSGPHFNLNIHGKKADYQCSPETWECTVIIDDVTGEEIVTKYASEGECNDLCGAPVTCTQVYGNVINIPFDNVDVDENGNDVINDPFQILIESGRKGPKGAPDITELQVTDSCAGFLRVDENGLPVSDGAASFRLPKNGDGYAVYAKITGKPGDDTKAIFNSPDFVYVEDENGNSLIELGQIVGTTLSEINSESITTYRSNTSKGNKVAKATNISALFDYSGMVCYFESYDPVDDFDYCLDYDQDPPVNVCTQEQLCCTTDDAGLYVGCAKLEDVGIADADGNIVCPIEIDGIPTNYTSVEVDCREYVNTWAFNIADFVGMLWDIGNNNAYNIKLRFYPLPLN